MYIFIHTYIFVIYVFIYICCLCLYKYFFAMYTYILADREQCGVFILSQLASLTPLQSRKSLQMGIYCLQRPCL